MNKLKISFLIISEDSNVSFETVGEMKNDRIKFHDPQEDINYIIFHNHTIEYYKRGSVDMKYRFLLNTKTEGTYKVYGNQFVFDILTDEVIHIEGFLRIKYRLYQFDDLVNETTIEIKYNPLKEE